MYAVIFRAEINELDADYSKTAKRLRELALDKYGCIEFVSATEGESEIAISYWNTKEEITRWKNDPEHVAAQKSGREKWYKSYTVQIVEVLREYHKGT